MEHKLKLNDDKTVIMEILSLRSASARSDSQIVVGEGAHLSIRGRQESGLVS